MTQCAAGTPSFRTSFLKMLDETPLNAIVIDVRGATSTIKILGARDAVDIGAEVQMNTTR